MVYNCGVKIEASILSADFCRLGTQVAELEESGLTDRLHVDVMDGHFVPNISVGSPVMESLRAATRLPMAVHLMITDPGRYSEHFVRAGAALIWVHYEACVHLHREVQAIKDLGVLAGVALNPATPVAMLSDIIHEVDSVLIMAVNPGFGGQRFIPGSLRRIAELREMVSAKGLATEIAVDGGVNEETAADVVGAGADTLVIGSALFRHPEGPAAALTEVREHIQRRRSA